MSDTTLAPTTTRPLRRRAPMARISKIELRNGQTRYRVDYKRRATDSPLSASLPAPAESSCAAG